VSSRRTLILIAAVLVGAVAAYALFTYVGGIEDEANENAERVQIYKIVQDIPKGTFGDEAFAQGFIEQDDIAQEYRPATAITDPSQIDGLVAISDLAANQVVVTNQFVTQQDSLSTFSQLLKNNEVAITVSVDQIRGVANLLVPGDFVNILITGGGASTETDTGGGGDGGQPGGDLVFDQPARFLYQKVQILAVGQTRKLEPGETAATNPDGTAAASSSSGLITFVVPADAAQKIASVDGGSIYLTLVAKDYQPTAIGPLDVNAELPGETEDQLTPYGPEGRPES
jgi:Flp pilus assembly protein CpaB